MQGFFMRSRSLTPCGLWLVIAGMDEKILYWMAWEYVCIPVRCIVALETVNVEGAIGISVVCNEVLYCLVSNLSSAVAVGKCSRGDSVVHSLVM